MKKKMLAIVLLLCLFAQGMALAEVPCTGFARVLKDDTNVRKSPGGDLSVKLDADEAVFVRSKKTDSKDVDWYEVCAMRQQKKIIGYIRGDLLELQSSLFADVKEVSMYSYHLVALRNDGSVLAIGNDVERTMGTKNWRNMRSVAAAHISTLGIHADGTPELLTYWGNDPLQWEGKFNRVIAGRDAYIGIREDGSVALHTFGWDSSESQLQLKEQEAAAGTVTQAGILYEGAYCLKSDGAVSSIFPYEDRFGDRWSGWTGLTDIALGYSQLVGLRGDGTVVTTLDIDGMKALSENEGNWMSDLYNQPNTWTQIKAIDACANYTVGLREDGTVLMAGDGPDTSGLSDIVWIHAAEQILLVGDAHGNSFALGDFHFWDLYDTKIVVTDSRK